MHEFEKWVLEMNSSKSAVESNIKLSKRRIKEREKQAKQLLEAREVLISVGSATQKQIMSYITSLCTLMLQTIYGERYTLVIDFNKKHNKSEASLKVYKGELELSLKDEETGGGVIDIVALAMRFAMWSLSSPRTAPVFLMDEPLKNVSKDKLPFVKEVLQELCEKINLQIIMVSHEEELIEIADKAYRVTMNNDISEVMEIG